MVKQKGSIKMIRHYSQRDSKTGYEMIFSDCTYNMAMFELQNIAESNNYWIEDPVTLDNGLVRITIRKDVIRGDYTYEAKVVRRYYWDENRGYLLGE